MQIARDSNYLASLDTIIEYIAEDSLKKALSFLDKLDNTISNIPNFPYKYRESLYYNNKNIRDLIFKGYAIPYLIDTNHNQIVILDIFKWINK